MSVRTAILVIITAIFRLSVAESQSVILMPRGRQFSLVKEASFSSSTAARTAGPLQIFIGARTVISCAVRCSQLLSCNSFSYKAIEQVCKVFVANRPQYSKDGNWSYYQSALVQSPQPTSNTRQWVAKASTAESTPQSQLSWNALATTKQSFGYGGNWSSDRNYGYNNLFFNEYKIAELVTLTTKDISSSTKDSTAASSSPAPIQTSAVTKYNSTSPAASHKTLSNTRRLTTTSISATTSSMKIPPVNCSFPFTLDGALYYKCVVDNKSSNDAGCFVANRMWFGCLPPLDFQAHITTVEEKFPWLNEPLLLISVHNWIVISQRIDGSVSFNRNWVEYKNGFGNFTGVSSNFWLGNENLYQLTRNGNCQLRAELQFNETGGWYSAEYSSFSVGSEADGYALHVAGYSGDAGDSLIRSDQFGADGMKFSTPDVDNDYFSRGNCAALYSSGWWMNYCYEANLNGIYGTGGMDWDAIVDDLKLLKDGWLITARMMIKTTG